MREFNGYPLTIECRKALCAAQQLALDRDNDKLSDMDVVAGVNRFGAVECARLHQLSLIAGRADWVLDLWRLPEKAELIAEHGAPLAERPEVRAFLWRAIAEARRLHDKYVSAFHLLLGLVADDAGEFGQELEKEGVDLKKAWRFLAAEKHSEYALPWPFAGRPPKVRRSDFPDDVATSQWLTIPLDDVEAAPCYEAATTDVQAVLTTSPASVDEFRTRYVASQTLHVRCIQEEIRRNEELDVLPGEDREGAM